MKFNLCFPFLKNIFKLKFDPDTEKAFFNSYYQNIIVIVRLGIFLGIILYALFGLLDNLMLPETKFIAWTIRFAIVIPALILTIAFSFNNKFHKVFFPVMILLSQIFGYGIIFMIFFSKSSEPGFHFYYSGLLLVIIWVGTFSQLYFKYSALSILLIIVGYVLLTVFKQNMVIGGFHNPHFPVFLNNSFFFLSASVISLFSSFSLEKLNRINFLKKQELSTEKQKSDNLLLNILPQSVADDLKEFGISKPQVYKNVTIFFSDIVGFTKISSEISPIETIKKLNIMFTKFDNIMEKNGCERIKTIGDAYFSVSGMPVSDPSHAENIVKAAIEIIETEARERKDSEIDWQIRIGIHTGDVVGGIVGIKKYIYDVFGDTVNIASRMETYSEPMKINISETTYNLVKNKFNFIERKPIIVKGKGKMKMYFVLTDLDSRF